MKQTVDLVNQYEFLKDKKFKLRASEDGFGSTKLNEKCDDIKNI